MKKKAHNRSPINSLAPSAVLQSFIQPLLCRHNPFHLAMALPPFLAVIFVYGRSNSQNACLLLEGSRKDNTHISITICLVRLYDEQHGRH